MGYRKPVISEIAYHTYAINEFGMATCFLLLGNEKGLLIDTGCGMSNIKESVEQLTNKPYDVVLTHGHVDHVICAPLFSEVYCHPNDWAEARAPKWSMAAAYPDMMRPFGSFDTYDIQPSDLRFYGPIQKLLPVTEGYKFELGGRSVEVIETPGHTYGSICLLDPISKILFSGDACNPNLGITATSVERTLDGLQKLKARQSEFNRNFNGHIGYGGSNINQSMPENNLDNDILICTHLLANDFEQYGKLMKGERFGRPIYSAVYDDCRINYDINRLWIKDEGKDVM